MSKITDLIGPRKITADTGTGNVFNIDDFSIVGGTNLSTNFDEGTTTLTLNAVGGGDLLAAGTVPLTAAWDAGSFSITAETFVSDIPTGTAPFTVASATVVTDLNASFLEGNAASAFEPADAAILKTGDVDDIPADGATTAPVSSNWAFDHAGGADPHTVYPLDTEVLKKDGSVALTAGWDVGAFGITALTFTSDQTTGIAPLVIASTTVVANLNASLLEGNAASAFEVVDATILREADVDDTPVDGVLTAPISSNWAFDHLTAHAPSGAEANEFSFLTISVATQSDVVAETTTDTLTLVAGTNIAITTDAGTDTITFNVSEPAWVVQTTSETAVSGDLLVVDTAAGILTTTLPLAPSAGDVVTIKTTVAGTNNLTIGRNSSNINGAAADVTLSTSFEHHVYVYVDATQGWVG